MQRTDSCPLAPMERCATGAFNVHCPNCVTLHDVIAAAFSMEMGESISLDALIRRALDADRKTAAGGVSALLKGRGEPGLIEQKLREAISSELEAARVEQRHILKDGRVFDPFIRIRRGRQRLIVEGLGVSAKARPLLLVLALAILEKLDRLKEPSFEGLAEDVTTSVDSEIHQIIEQ